MIGRLRDTFQNKDSLKYKVLISAMLSSTVFAGQIILRLASTIILTRILTPDTFGVFAIVISFIVILEMFSDIGVRSLILTKEDEIDDAFLRSCWTAQILRGLLIASISGPIALAVAWGQSAEIFPPESGYVAPALPYAIFGLGAVAFLNGFASPSKFVYEKDMRFKLVTQCNLLSAFLTMIATVGLALWLQSIWALVLGQVVRAFIEITMSFRVFSGPSMRLNWQRDHVKIILDRGKWIMGHSGLTAVINMADRLLLGFAMSSTTFGFYYIGRQIVDMVEAFLNSMHAQMGLQVFTEFHRTADAADLRRRYYRYRIVFDFVAMFGAGMLLALAPLIVDTIYDDRYTDVTEIIQILSIGLILIGPGLLREAFSAQRRFKTMTMLSLVRAASIWTGLCVAILVFESPVAALFVVALHRIPETILLLNLGRKEAWVSLLREVRFLPFVVLGAALGLGIDRLWTMIAQ